MSIDKQKILIVDDMDINRSILADIIKDDYVPIEAEDGAEAIRILKNDQSFSLVLLDLLMPKMDGFEVLEEMKKEGIKVPVIIISSDGQSESIERAFKLGVVDFINRPFDAILIKNRILNTILLFEKQKKLLELISSKLEKEDGSTIDLNNFKDLKESVSSTRTIKLLDKERMKNDFFTSMAQELYIEYDCETRVMKAYGSIASMLGIPMYIDNVHTSEVALKVFEKNTVQFIHDKLLETTALDPLIETEVYLNCNGQKRLFKVYIRTLWENDDQTQYTGALAKLVDIQDEADHISELERLASHDSMTGLLNNVAATNEIDEVLKNNPKKKYAMIFFDVDHFKKANDTFGHQFGNDVLVHMADKIKKISIRNDITSRVGGDEFIIFTEYRNDAELLNKTEQVFSDLCGEYGDFTLTISMGVASTENSERNFDALFYHADKALYKSKQLGRNRFCFYSKSVENSLKKTGFGE